MSDERDPTDKLSTGSGAFDEILGGGIPLRSLVVLAGEPGSGKTVLALQMLFSLARRGGTSLYFTTLSEPALKLIGFMQRFEFFDPALAKDFVHFVDLGQAIRRGPDETMDLIESSIAKFAPAAIVIDSFRAMAELLSPETARRPFVYDLSVQLAGSDAVTLLIGEYGAGEVGVLPEFAVADGIIRLGSERQELTSVRELEVAKLRGTGYVTGKHFFEIDRKGLAVYPRVRAPDDPRGDTGVASLERVGTGIAGVDELLDGGLPKGSSTLVQGPTGCGKTLLALQFLIEGAKHGERGVLFTLEETTAQLRAIARAIGWDLEAFERQQLLSLRYTSPVELSTDKFVQSTREAATALGTRRMVVDSLTTLSLGIASERRFKEMVYAVCKLARADDVSLVMTSESDQLLGAAHLSGHGVSFIADTLIQLRYVELEGRLERAISVLKARGIRHDTEVRSFRIREGGLDAEKGRFQDMRGVLTGLPARRTGGRS